MAFLPVSVSPPLLFLSFPPLVPLALFSGQKSLVIVIVVAAAVAAVAIVAAVSLTPPCASYTLLMARVSTGFVPNVDCADMRSLSRVRSDTRNGSAPWIPGWVSSWQISSTYSSGCTQRVKGQTCLTKEGFVLSSHILTGFQSNSGTTLPVTAARQGVSTRVYGALNHVF